MTDNYKLIGYRTDQDFYLINFEFLTILWFQLKWTCAISFKILFIYLFILLFIFIFLATLVQNHVPSSIVATDKCCMSYSKTICF